jgi:glycine/D-amino acid oxidase-like deaminating enzyme
MRRRHFIAGASAWATLAPAPVVSTAQTFERAAFAEPTLLAPIRASVDRIIDVTVCTRPFRAQGPRIEAQALRQQTLIHNYGHGGSGWSLSWGSAQLAVQMALATGEKRLGVIGCGAIGLTTAVVAQRAGLRVRIYCRERPPEVRSSAATGVWSPSSRICTEAQLTPAFEQRWQRMARYSFRRFQSLLGLAGEPVEWRDGYVLSDLPFDQAVPRQFVGEPEYAHLDDLLSDMDPNSHLLTPAQHPFPVAHARRYTQLVFNLPSYFRLLMDDFLRQGGEIEQRDFQSLRQFSALRERTLVNATGWGARTLFDDDSLIPVRGQTARLVPQPEVNYGINYRGHNLSVVSRRDGIVVQAHAEGDFGNANSAPDRAASDAAVRRLAALFRT